MHENTSIITASLYERIGGERPLRKFVRRLYGYMDSLPEVEPVRAMHTMSLDEAGDRLFKFLSGWLGGPPLYQQDYGEPRLRRRHLHVPIGYSERDQWLLCARKALDDMDWPHDERRALMQRLQDMADHLRNQGPLNIGCVGPG